MKYFAYDSSHFLMSDGTLTRNLCLFSCLYTIDKLIKDRRYHFYIFSMDENSKVECLGFCRYEHKGIRPYKNLIGITVLGELF